MLPVLALTLPVESAKLHPSAPCHSALASNPPRHTPALSPRSSQPTRSLPKAISAVRDSEQKLDPKTRQSTTRLSSLSFAEGCPKHISANAFAGNLRPFVDVAADVKEESPEMAGGRRVSSLST